MRPMEPASRPPAGRPSGTGRGRPQPAGTPWSVRAARGPGLRPALEIYESGRLIGLMVDTPLAPQLLRGARRARRGSRPRAIAWGRRPADGADVEVVFLRRLPRRACPARFACLTTWCWVAVAEGSFGQVEAVAGGDRERRRLRPGREW